MQEVDRILLEMMWQYRLLGDLNTPQENEKGLHPRVDFPDRSSLFDNDLHAGFQGKENQKPSKVSIQFLSRCYDFSKNLWISDSFDMSPL